ncbi:hypothetical protein, partial [Muribaculum intestinale]
KETIDFSGVRVGQSIDVVLIAYIELTLNIDSCTLISTMKLQKENSSQGSTIQNGMISILRSLQSLFPKSMWGTVDAFPNTE